MQKSREKEIGNLVVMEGVKSLDVNCSVCVSHCAIQDKVSMVKRRNQNVLEMRHPLCAHRQNSLVFYLNHIQKIHVHNGKFVSHFDWQGREQHSTVSVDGEIVNLGLVCPEGSEKVAHSSSANLRGNLKVNFRIL